MSKSRSSRRQFSPRTLQQKNPKLFAKVCVCMCVCVCVCVCV